MPPDPPAGRRFAGLTGGEGGPDGRPATAAGEGGLDRRPAMTRGSAGRVGPEPAHAEAGRTGGGPGPAVVLLAVTAVLAVSILKPWDAGAASPDGAAPDPGVVGLPVPTGAAVALPAEAPGGPGDSSADPDGTAAPADRTPRPPSAMEPTVLPAIPGPEGLAEALLPRDEWGLRAIVFEPATGAVQAGPDARLVERWIRADVEGSRRSLNAPAAFAGDAVVALGLTAPPGVQPVAVRIWRLSELELPQRVAVEEIPGPGPFGVLWRPGRSATALGTWPRGSYRVDVVLADRVVRIYSAIPTGARMEARLPPLAMGPAPDVAAAIRGMDAGVFAVSGPEVVRVAADPVEPMGELDAWLSPACAAPAGPCPVGTLVSRTVSAVGVVLEAGAVPTNVEFRLLAPVPRSPRMLAGILATGPAGAPASRTAVLLRVDSPGPLSSGLYRLTLDWLTAAGESRTASWHVEIVPPGLEPSGILAP